MPQLRIITPVYNDWSSCSLLLQRLDELAGTLGIDVFVTAVDDGSSESSAAMLAAAAPLQHLLGAEVLKLGVNVGHQRAIAVALCVAVEDDSADWLVIMDADGEDPPHEIEHLIQQINGRTDFCLVAERRKRTERVTFRLAYMTYRLIFRAVTGRKIRFGNFCMLSRSSARRLVLVSDLWNNLPAAVLRSRIPIDSIPIDRGKRYTGRSKMNFTSLVIHGLSGLSVHADTIFVRLLFLSLMLMVLGALLIVTVFTLRVFVPAHATPGWATTVSFGVVIITLQVLFTTLSSLLMLLNSRVQQLVVPALQYKVYVERRILFLGRMLANEGPSSNVETS